MTTNKVIKQPNEKERLEALQSLNILETPLEERFERITRLVCNTLDVAISAVSCIDLHRQWFKSIQGLNVDQTERCVAFCQHTIQDDKVLVIPDARFDDRFASNPLVTGDPGIVFYAGAPIFSEDGMPVATLCIIDREPRSLSDNEIQTLYDFARVVEEMLHTPRQNIVEETLINQIGESWRAGMIDPLTRTWNAEGIKTLIEETVNHANRSEETVCVSKLTLGRVKAFDSEHGPAAGDILISTFARECLTLLEPHDSIGHLLRDEFSLILTKVKDEHDVIDRLLKFQQLADCVQMDGIDGSTRLSARVAALIVPPGSKRDIHHLLGKVEDAMRDAETNAQDMLLVRTYEADTEFESAA